MLSIEVTFPDGKSYTQHFRKLDKAKSFLDRLIEQSGGTRPTKRAADVKPRRAAKVKSRKVSRG